jgi:hypothetical protein
MASLKIDYKPNADDNMSDLLAEAEYIFNNADEVLASFGVEEDECLLAA